MANLNKAAAMSAAAVGHLQQQQQQHQQRMGHPAMQQQQVFISPTFFSMSDPKKLDHLAVQKVPAFWNSLCRNLFDSTLGHPNDRCW